jgi:cytochrome b6-f complex iron-sulfur subunit
MNRRTFLAGGVQTCGIAAVAAGGYITARFLTPIPDWSEEDVEIREEELKPGDAVLVMHKGKPALVLRDPEGRLHALSAVCTHLGCLVKWDAGQQKIVCPCHDATFAIGGEVLSGPAPEALPRIPIGIKDGIIRLEESS